MCSLLNERRDRWRIESTSKLFHKISSSLEILFKNLGVSNESNLERKYM
jgi:hypothetical protein